MNKIFQNTKCLTLEDIQLYVSDKASEDKSYEIENHLIDCPLCSDAVEGFANHPQGLESIEEVLPPNFVEQPEDNAMVKPMRNNRFTLRSLAAAIAILVIPSMAIYMYYNANQEQRLFKQNFETYSDASLSGLRSASNSNENALITNGIRAYSSKDYDGSLLYFEKYLDENENAEMAFYAGLSALEANQLQKAVDYLTVARINSEAYYLEATWYLALAYLKRNESEEARIILTELAKQNDDYYNKKAETLLKNI